MPVKTGTSDSGLTLGISRDGRTSPERLGSGLRAPPAEMERPTGGSPDPALSGAPLPRTHDFWHTTPIMKTPAQKTWLAILFPPERFAPLEVRLSDNSVKRAVWTGAKWWCDGREVTPAAWRPLYQSELEAVAS